MTTIEKQEISEAYEEVRDDASSVTWWVVGGTDTIIILPW